MAKRSPRAKRLEREQPDFRGIRLNRHTPSAMEAALERQHRLQFAVAWTRQRPLVLLSLQVKAAPGNLWLELLPHPMSDNDGQLVVEMGFYSAGAVGVRFALGALAAIAKSATFLVEDELKVTPFKPPPGAGTRSLAQGEQWRDAGTYDIGAQA